jgi:hypothetical protein
MWKEPVMNSLKERNKVRKKRERERASPPEEQSS